MQQDFLTIFTRISILIYVYDIFRIYRRHIYYSFKIKDVQSFFYGCWCNCHTLSIYMTRLSLFRICVTDFFIHDTTSYQTTLLALAIWSQVLPYILHQQIFSNTLDTLIESILVQSPKPDEYLICDQAEHFTDTCNIFVVKRLYSDIISRQQVT